MKKIQFVTVIGITVCSLVVAASQTKPLAPLSGPLRDVVKDGRFAIITSVGGLPLGVRDRLKTLFGTDTLELAQPGADFQVDDLVVNPRLPIRRLVAAACTMEYCLVYYERGGVDHTWHVALFHWAPEGTRLEWGAAAPGGLKTIDAVRKAILSGAIKGPASFW